MWICKASFVRVCYFSWCTALSWKGHISFVGDAFEYNFPYTVGANMIVENLTTKLSKVLLNFSKHLFGEKNRYFSGPRRQVRLTLT